MRVDQAAQFLGADWRSYQHTFRAAGVTGASNLNFNLGFRTGSVWLADVVLEKGKVP